MGMCKWFFRDANKIHNGCQRSALKNVVGAKTLKLSQKLFKFYYHIPHDMEMCRWLFRGFTEIQNGRHRSTLIFWGGLKKICLVDFFSNINITFLATWGCASDFLKMLPNFKMAARGQLQLLLAQKLKNFKSEIIQILPSHSPRYGDVQVIFWKVLLKFKMAAMYNLHIFLLAQELKNWNQ